MSSDRWEQLKRATAEAFADPRVGDRFHEMYSHWIYIVDMGTESVTVYESNCHPQEMPECGGRLTVYLTRQQFSEAHQYGRGNADYYVTLCDRDNDVTGWLATVIAQKKATADSAVSAGSGTSGVTR